MAKVSVSTLAKKKQQGEKITALTAYDASFAKLFYDNGVDVVLVGDSLGMVLQGGDDTLAVTTADDVILYVGDNLADFDHAFDSGSPVERKQFVDSLESGMQDNFVLLPNVLYGTWMGAVHKHSYDWTEAELKQNRLENIKATTIN